MNRLSLGFVGDLSLTVLNDEAWGGIEEIGRQCRHFTDRVDVAVANLESIITPSGSECTRMMAVNAEKCQEIEGLQFDVFSLANNHILDCGAECLNYTMEFLKQRGVSTVGAGKDLAQAEAPLILEVSDKKVGFLSVTDATHYRATKSRPGVAPLNKRRLLRSIRSVKDSLDLLVVSIHSDLEFTNMPAPWKVRLSRQLVRAGANLVIHHHPHTLQGIEQYRGGLIAYSLGNFIFPVHGIEYMNNKNGFVAETIFLTVKVGWESGSNISMEYDVAECVIDDRNHLRPADPARAEQIRRKLMSYNSCLGEPEALRSAYFRECVAQGKQVLFGLYYEFRRKGLRAPLRTLKHYFSTRMHRNWMRGLLSLGMR